MWKKAWSKSWQPFLHPTTHALFDALLYHVNYWTGECFPGHEYLRRKLKKKCKKTVQRHVDTLLEVGLLLDVVPHHERASSPGLYPLSHSRRTNLYEIECTLACRLVYGRVKVFRTSAYLTDHGRLWVDDPRNGIHDLFHEEYGGYTSDGDSDHCEREGGDG